MGTVRALPNSALAARCHSAWVDVEQDCEVFLPRPANVNAGARESLVTEGAWCPFCAATIKRKIPYNGKTSYNGKRKLAQDTLSLPHVRIYLLIPRLPARIQARNRDSMAIVAGRQRPD
jgi:hypothetical protein